MKKLLLITAIMAISTSFNSYAEELNGIQIVPAPKHVACTKVNSDSFSYTVAGFDSEQQAREHAEGMNEEGAYVCKANREFQW